MCKQKAYKKAQMTHVTVNTQSSAKKENKKILHTSCQFYVFFNSSYNLKCGNTRKC